MSNLKLAYVALEPRTANILASWCSISSLHCGFDAIPCNRLNVSYPSGAHVLQRGRKNKKPCKPNVASGLQGLEIMNLILYENKFLSYDCLHARYFMFTCANINSLFQLSKKNREYFHKPSL